MKVSIEADEWSNQLWRILSFDTMFLFPDTEVGQESE